MGEHNLVIMTPAWTTHFPRPKRIRPTDDAQIHDQERILSIAKVQNKRFKVLTSGTTALNKRPDVILADQVRDPQGLEQRIPILRLLEISRCVLSIDHHGTFALDHVHTSAGLLSAARRQGSSEMVHNSGLGLLRQLLLGLGKLRKHGLDGRGAWGESRQLVELGDNQAVLRGLERVDADCLGQGVLTEPVGAHGVLGRLGGRAALTVGGVKGDDELVIDGVGGEIRGRLGLELEAAQGVIAVDGGVDLGDGGHVANG